MVGTASEELLSLTEAADRLGVSVYTVRRWIKAGQLRAFRPGKEYRIQESDLEEFLRAREVRPKAPIRSPLEPTFNGLLEEEERRARLGEVERYIDELVFKGAEYYEQELEQGRATDYRTANAASKLADHAVEYFSRIIGYLFSYGPARPLWEAMEQGAGLEIEEEYDTLLDKLRERTKQTRTLLFDHAARLAETEAQRDEIAAKHREAEAALDANVGRRSA